MPYLDVSERLRQAIEHAARQKPTQVTLRQLYEYARVADEPAILSACRWLQREMSIRLARKIIELEAFPPRLSNTTGMALVRAWYIQSFEEMTSQPPVESTADEERFRDLITAIKARHRNQAAVMARGIQEYMARENMSLLPDDLQTMLDSFYVSRIGIRVLLGHFADMRLHREGWYGIICAKTFPREVAETAAQNAATLCRQSYGDPPEVRILGLRDLSFRYIPSHLGHVLFELLKNSFRATIEHHLHQGRSGPLPPVTIVIAGGNEDVAIRISDEGGGIPRSGLDRIWSYSYTTARQQPGPYGGDQTVMAGYGYGLPISRLYARYFGGDLRLMSLEGYGTDAYLHLSRLGNLQESVR